MASSSTKKQCANGDGCKQAAVTNCEGCSKAFCIKHMIDHRRLLDEEMNVIIDDHDHLKNTLNQHITKSDSHPLIKEINNWEKESIAKIQTRAKELRQELLQSTSAHVDDLSKKLGQLSEHLKNGREHDDFIETDLQLWKKTLDDLKTSLVSPATISINRYDNVSLVQNISVNLLRITKELFERVLDNAAQIKESGQIVCRSNWGIDDMTEVRGKIEYGSGCHTVRLRIEQLSSDWIFLGINAKSTPLQKLSHHSKSAYGWSSNNNIWLNGSCRLSDSNSTIEMKVNDVIVLIFDCDSSEVSMINERTKATHSLVVDVQKCPLPWQLHVVLRGGSSRVRILPG
jgi:hypothetical protein